MAIYDYKCSNKDCEHFFTAYNQSPSSPQKKCPVCGKETLFIHISEAPICKDKWSLVRGGEKATIYQDIRKRIKKNINDK